MPVLASLSVDFCSVFPMTLDVEQDTNVKMKCVEALGLFSVKFQNAVAQRDVK